LFICSDYLRGPVWPLSPVAWIHDDGRLTSNDLMVVGDDVVGLSVRIRFLCVTCPYMLPLIFLLFGIYVHAPCKSG
jgi:hypothetical protein